MRVGGEGVDNFSYVPFVSKCLPTVFYIFIDLPIFELHSVAGFQSLYLSNKSTGDRSDIQLRIFPIHRKHMENDTQDSQYLGNHKHLCHQTFERLIDREMSVSVVVFFVSVAFFLFGWWDHSSLLYQAVLISAFLADSCLG